MWISRNKDKWNPDCAHELCAMKPLKCMITTNDLLALYPLGDEECDCDMEEFADSIAPADFNSELQAHLCECSSSSWQGLKQLKLAKECIKERIAKLRLENPSLW